MTKIKAALISLGSTSSQWTLKAMKNYFDEVDEIDVREIEINLGSKDNPVLYKGEPLKQYDCIYAKGSFRYASVLRSVTELVSHNTCMPIKSKSFTLGHNKLLTHLKMQTAGVPMPTTYLTPNPDAAKELLKKINYPIIMKFPEGTQGKGVMFADSYASASSMLDALATLNQPFIIQEYIETEGKDIRALVIGIKVVAAMERTAVKGEKRANIHAGGTGKATQIDTHTQKIAIKAAKAIGADICAVDILEGKGPLVIEINLSPGLQGITKATSIDIADKIARHLYKQTKPLVEVKEGTKASKILQDLGIDDSTPDGLKEIITPAEFRGERLLLPDIATKIADLKEKEEITLKVKKGYISIEKGM